MDETFVIRALQKNETEYIQKIAQWFFDEWEIPIEKTVHRLKSQPNYDIFFQLVALNNNTLCSTIALCNIVNLLSIYPHLNKIGPWVALFYTDKVYRGHGLGKRLLEDVDIRAKELGLNKIYLYTNTAERLYVRNGWKALEKLNYKDTEMVLMEKDL